MFQILNNLIHGVNEWISVLKNKKQTNIDQTLQTVLTSYSRTFFSTIFFIVTFKQKNDITETNISSKT